MFTRRTVAAALLAASMAGTAVAQEKEIKIGGLMATSGPMAFLGDSEKKAFDMVIEQMNAAGGMAGFKIKPVFYDTEGNATLAAQQFRRLVDSDKVAVVIGPSSTGESLALKSVANELKTPLISLGGAESIVTPPTPYVFKTPPTDRIVANHILTFMKAKGLNSVALLSSADGFGQAGAVVVKEVANQLGVKMVAAEEFGPRDTDMTPQLLKIRASGADTLLIWSVNPGPTIILKNAAAIGYNKPIINSYGGATPQLVEQAGAAAENTYVSSMRLLAPDSLAADDPLRAVVTKLAGDYKSKFKSDVTTFIAHPADGLRLVEEAVKKTGSVDREKLAAAMASGVRFVGGNGIFNYTAENRNGLDASSQSMVMLKVQGGKFVIAK